MFPIYNLQDISLNDVELKSQYYSLFMSGNITQAQALYDSNPQLRGKVVNADMLNLLVVYIVVLEIEWFSEVPWFLDNLSTQFQIKIDELIYMNQYNTSAQYEINNFVLSSGVIYYCYKRPPIGTAPSNSNYWVALGLKGENGSDTLGVNYQGQWQSITSYARLDMVVFNNELYVAKTNNTNKPPNISSNEWFKAVQIVPQSIYTGVAPPAEGFTDGDIWFKIIS